MKLNWNLNDLFKNVGEFYKEIENIKNLILNIKTYEKQELDENSLLDLLNEKWKIKELTNNVLIYGSLRYYKDIKSEECIELKSTAENFNSQVNLDLGFIDRKILALGREKIDEFLAKNSELQIYKQFLDNLFRMQEHVQNDDINVMIKDNIDNINLELNKYNNLLRDIKYGQIEIDGKPVEINSSNFSSYLSSRDRKTRKNAYLTVNQSFKNSEDHFASILDSIYGYRIKNAEYEKYNSILEKVLFEENIDSKVIDSLISSMNNNLDLFQKYLRLKADFLKIDEPHLYDFGVPLDNDLKVKYSIEEAVQIIKNALQPLGDEYLKIIDYLLDGHFDAEPDENKHQSIIFSWHTYSFMNFRGSYIDLRNMAHELGHIVNYYLSMKKLPFIYEDSTVFVGETASTVNECLIDRYLYQNADTLEEKIFYLSKEIEKYFTLIFRQTMYTEFEQDLYNAKLSHNLTGEMLSEKYGKLIRKYYGDNVVYDEVSNVEWTRLGHLYRHSYYPYKYATGLIIANIVVDSIQDDKSLSKEEYLEFLSLGSSLYSLDLLKTINIDLTDTSVIDNGFKMLREDIEEFEKILSLKK